jgi:aspartate/methionine/tyrosine aminotransferase
MTGWRLGWLVAPAAMETDLGKLTEYNTSCAPEFIQAAGVTALEEGEPHVAALRKSLMEASSFMTDQLRAIEGVEITPPTGGMYVMLRVAGEDDAVSLCKRLVQEARLGLAPGEAFGPESAGWIRWCIATDISRLRLGVERLKEWIAQSRK